MVSFCKVGGAINQIGESGKSKRSKTPPQSLSFSFYSVRARKTHHMVRDGPAGGGGGGGGGREGKNF